MSQNVGQQPQEPFSQSQQQRSPQNNPHRRKTAASSESDASSWYTRYQYYPEYCGTPEQMNKRAIPPLPDHSRAGDSRLLQVTAVIRHGARTPWNAPPDHKRNQKNDQNNNDKGDPPGEDATASCWPGYDPTWDCDLTTWVSTPSSWKNEGTTTTTGEGMFWLDKEYTALKDPNHNIWGGTCQRGQLIKQGYVQELHNGKFLRDAYVYQGPKDFQHDQRLRLLDATTVLQNDATLQQNIYYRSDDEPRTTMSGQLVLRGMLQAELDQYYNTKKTHPILPLHMGDIERDVLTANTKICPRLEEIAQKFYDHSGEYQAFLDSDEIQYLTDFQQHVLLGGRADLDCLMTTTCTDRELPDALRDYFGEKIGSRNYFLPLEYLKTADENNHHHDRNEDQKNGKHIFQRLAEYSAAPTNLLYTANGGEFSKLVMGPLWKEITHHIQAATNGSSKGDPTPAKFALFSGHDSTLIPLLASLGVWYHSDFWPAYASMVLLEIHEVNFGGNTDSKVYPSNYAFRLLYNGEVWTSRVKGCPASPEHLCDLNILMNIVSPLLDRDCGLEYSAFDRLKAEEEEWPTGVVASLSFALGMICTMSIASCCCSNDTPNNPFKKGRLRRRRQEGQHHLVSNGEEGEDGIMLSNSSGYRDEVGPSGGGFRDHSMLDEEGPEDELGAGANGNSSMGTFVT